MPPPQRRRRGAAEEEDEEEEEDEDQEMELPRRNDPRAYSEGDEDEEPEANDPNDDGGEDSANGQLVKKLVRYALACEFSRTPIRRDGIKDKVLGPHGRAFKKVFARAQKQLNTVFGMELVEMPAKDRSILSLDQKRKAGKSQTQGQTSSNAYMLVSILPAEYRIPEIIAPSKAHSQEGEASYVGMYTTLISIITLSGGELSDARLRRHLQRLVIDKNMPSLNPNDANHATENTEIVLQRMIRQGYLVKTSENKMQGDDDSITWHVGPRGKVEVSNEAIAEMIRKIYGGSSPELEKKLQSSLKITEVTAPAPAAGGAIEEESADQSQADQDGEPGPSSVRRSRRRAAEDNADEAGPSTARRSRRRVAEDNDDDE